MQPVRVEVLVWSAFLSQKRLSQLYATLATDEQTRAAAFRHEQAGREFVAGRGVAREVLAARCGCHVADIVFGVNSYGKPQLSSPSSRIAFSLTHSAGVCAMALGKVARLGVDIEARTSDRESLEDSIFSGREAYAFASLPPSLQSEALFRSWVIKEAYLKAIGEGLSGGMSSLEVSFLRGAVPRPISIRGDTEALAGWRFDMFDASAHIVGAIAVDIGNEDVAIEIRRMDAEQAIDRKLHNQ